MHNNSQYNTNFSLSSFTSRVLQFVITKTTEFQGLKRKLKGHIPVQLSRRLILYWFFEIYYT